MSDTAYAILGGTMGVLLIGGLFGALLENSKDNIKVAARNFAIIIGLLVALGWLFSGDGDSCGYFHREYVCTNE